MDEGWHFLLDQTISQNNKALINGDWITMIALSGTIIMGALGYSKRPSFISAGRIKDLHEEMIDLRAENKRLRNEVEVLKTTEWQLRRDSEFWQEQYRMVLMRRPSSDDSKTHGL